MENKFNKAENIKIRFKKVMDIINEKTEGLNITPEDLQEIVEVGLEFWKKKRRNKINN